MQKVMIFFDIDGTLLDHEQAERLGAIDFYYRNCNELKIQEDTFIRLWNQLSIKYFKRYVAKEITFQQQRQMRIQELFGQHLTSSQADEKFYDYLTSYKNNWKAYDDVIPCLNNLKELKVRLGIISNGDFEQQIDKLKSMNILHYFECVITSSTVKVSKPNIEIFTEACRRANVKLDASYYIGDVIETDVIGSCNSGMKGVWLNRTRNTCKQLNLVEIHNLYELIDVLNNS